MTHLRLLALLAFAATAVADVPSTFPTQYADHESFRVVAVASGYGRTITRTTRGSSDQVLVLDDADSVHFEYSAAPPYPVNATWKAKSRHVALMRYTPETVDAAEQWALDQFGISMRLRMRAGPARLRFSADGSEYHGTQIIRASGRYRGVIVNATETVRYRGTRM